MSIESETSTNNFILCRPLLRPSIFPSIRVLSSETAFPSSGQSIGISASVSVLPMNIQGWFHLGLIGLILRSKGLSRVFFRKTIPKHQFFGVQPLWYNSHLHTWLLKKTTAMTIQTFVGKVMSATVSIVSPSICHEVMGLDAMILVFLNVEF